MEKATDFPELDDGKRESIEQTDHKKLDLYERYVLGEIKASEYKSRKAELDAEAERLKQYSFALTACLGGEAV